jgi:hypothetical protein
VRVSQPLLHELPLDFGFLPPLKLQPRQATSLSDAMRTRHYTPADLDALRRLHAAQGFGYPFPDLDSPLFITKLVLEEDESRTGFSLSHCSDAMGSAGGGEASKNEEPGSSEGTGREVASREVASREARHRSSPSETAGRESSPRAQQTHAGAPRIVMAVLLRLTAEAYLLHDTSAGTPRQRWQNLLALHEAARRDAAARGLDDVQAFLPPRVARAFGRRLARLGWRQDPWPCFSKVVSG